MKKKNLLSLAMVLLLLLSLTACGGSSKAPMENAAADRAPAMMENGMLTTDSASGAVALPELIQKASAGEDFDVTRKPKNWKPCSPLWKKKSRSLAAMWKTGKFITAAPTQPAVTAMLT